MPVEPTNGNFMALTIFLIIAIIVYMFILRCMDLLKTVNCCQCLFSRMTLQKSM